ncbi:hypothetical protein DFH27DRAFT_604353 [Peziza echinospora]|nr:hypothetical protein DFH27DRAFT_604353 [Peziza echinospora]
MFGIPVGGGGNAWGRRIMPVYRGQEAKLPVDDGDRVDEDYGNAIKARPHQPARNNCPFKKFEGNTSTAPSPPLQFMREPAHKECIITPIPSPPHTCSRMSVEPTATSAAAATTSTDGETHWTPRINVPPLTLSPAKLEQLTGADLAELMRNLHDQDTILVPSISLDHFAQWQATTAGDMFDDHGSGSHDLAKLRRFVKFYPRAKGDGIDDQTKTNAEDLTIGDVMIRFITSPYHDAVFPSVQVHIERAVCERTSGGGGGGNQHRSSGLKYKAAPGIRGFHESAQYPSIHGALVRMPDGAIYPPAPLDGRKPKSFPTVVFEVGFSETFAELLNDVALFLLGTEGVTRAAVVIQLVELQPAVQPVAAKKRKSKKKDKTKNNTMKNDSRVSPWYTLGQLNQDRSHAPPPPTAPTALSTASEWKSSLRALQKWFIEMDTAGLLSQPLVGPLDGFLSVYRPTEGKPDDASGRSNDNAGKSAAAAPAQAEEEEVEETPSIPGIHCTYKTKFMHHDTPVPDATYSLLIGDLYGLSTPYDGSALEQPLPGVNLDPNDEIILPLGPLATQVKEERWNMVEERAWQRATSVNDKHREALLLTTPKVPSARVVIDRPVLPNGMILRERTKQQVDENDENTPPIMRSDAVEYKDESWVQMKKRKLNK